jgi:murein L,D-transpeptidase YcbB/YkuD
MTTPVLRGGADAATLFKWSRLMRNGRCGRFLAGVVLASAVAVPTIAVSAPDPAAIPMPDNRNAVQHDSRPAIRRDAPPTLPAAPPAAAKPAPDRTMPARLPSAGEKLREIVTSSQLDKRIDRADDRKSVQSFYAARGYAPLWIHDGALTAQARAVVARLRNASTEGLNAADYPVPQIGAGAEAIADADLRLTASLLDFVRHLAVGRIAPRRVLSDIDYGDHAPDPSDVLTKVSQARDIDAVFDSYDPSDADFRALKRKLAELRAESGNGDDERIADGRPIKPGAKDERIPALRARLQVKGRANDTTYGRRLHNVIRGLQHDAGMRPTGIIDSKTLALINGPTRGEVIDRVLANMERWRWLPHDLGRNYVMVNIPDYTLKVVSDRRVVWRTKIVAGKPATPTPLVSAPMAQVIVNPSWHVPQSIIQNELLPAYGTDPNIFARMGLEVKRGPGGHIRVVQPPGAANALGRIKFAFPNKFQVYLHDTPEKRLFSYSKRAFSHGCMRVEDPTKFGEILLSLAMKGPAPDSRQIHAMFGREEHTFKLVDRPMVHLTYQTAFVDDGGRLELRDDIYGYDARIHAILHSDERKIADVAPPPDPKRDLATLKSNQEILRRVERREAVNPSQYFERLFR